MENRLAKSPKIWKIFSLQRELLGEGENSRFIVEFPSYFPSWIGSLSIVTLNATALPLEGS